MQDGFPWAPPSADTHYVFRVEYNHVHQYGLGILSDFGAIYVSPQPSCWMPGAKRTPCNMATLIKSNRIHDAVCYDYGAVGVYSDEAGAGVDVADNVIYDLDGSGISFHCGVNLTADNNFIVGADRLGQRGALSACNMDGFTVRVPVDFDFSHNIIYVTGNASHLMASSELIDNSTFDSNVYFVDASSPLVFFRNKTFQQWQDEGKVGRSLIAASPPSAQTNCIHLVYLSSAKQRLQYISSKSWHICLLNDN